MGGVGFIPTPTFESKKAISRQEVAFFITFRFS